MTKTITTTQLRAEAAVLADVYNHDERYVVTLYNRPYVAIIPLVDLQRLEAPVNASTPEPTYAQIDADRRTEFKRDTLDRLRALVGRDKLEALRLLTELQAELLANGSSNH